MYPRTRGTVTCARALFSICRRRGHVRETQKKRSENRGAVTMMAVVVLHRNRRGGEGGTEDPCDIWDFASRRGRREMRCARAPCPCTFDSEGCVARAAITSITGRSRRPTSASESTDVDAVVSAGKRGTRVEEEYKDSARATRRRTLRHFHGDVLIVVPSILCCGGCILRCLDRANCGTTTSTSDRTWRYHRILIEPTRTP